MIQKEQNINVHNRCEWSTGHSYYWSKYGHPIRKLIQSLKGISSEHCLINYSIIVAPNFNLYLWSFLCGSYLGETVWWKEKKWRKYMTTKFPKYLAFSFRKIKVLILNLSATENSESKMNFNCMNNWSNTKRISWGGKRKKTLLL